MTLPHFLLVSQTRSFCQSERTATSVLEYGLIISRAVCLALPLCVMIVDVYVIIIIIITCSMSTGRPRIAIDMEEVELLRRLSFTWTKIAELLQVSRATLYRRLGEEGISHNLSYTDISDRDLDAAIEAIKVNHPNDGEVLMAGHLCSRGIIVPRARLRASIHRVDPVNTAARRSVTIRRRVYFADGPNAMWHIDGNHKLIRWRFVVHGGIDGYSRTIVYLQCVDNNRAPTVLDSFTAAVHAYGLPCRIRSDLGGENVEVWRYMVEQHSSDSAVITGSSTHNERIERLWRDYFRCIGVNFYDTFRMLEEQGKLDSLNEVDLYCLHYVFEPRINSSLQAFVESWNNHTISTAGNLTPNQLFVQGAIERNRFPQYPPNPSHSHQHSVPVHANTNVRVPRISFKPCLRLKQLLLIGVNPLDPCNDFGCTMYNHACCIVGQHLLRGCSNCVE